MEQVARTSKQVGEAVRRVRRLRGLTQMQLGAKMDARQTTISKLEVGESQLRTLMDALAALDLELIVRPRSGAGLEDIETLF